MANPDVARLINSDEIQSALRPAVVGPQRRTTRKNPLTNRSVRARLDPLFLQKQRANLAAKTEGTAERKALLEKKREREAVSFCIV